MAPYSDANPQGNPKDSWLDKGWPLTRFIGYRPPPSDDAAAKHWTAGADHVLPAPLRDRHRQKRREDQLKKEGPQAEKGRPNGGGPVDQQRPHSDGQAEKGTKAQTKGEDEKKGPSLGQKVKHKLWDMWLTLLGCFFGIAFASLGEPSGLHSAAACLLSLSLHPGTQVVELITFECDNHRSLQPPSVPKPCSCESRRTGLASSGTQWKPSTDMLRRPSP